MKPVWIVDDDQSIRWVLEKALTRENIPHKSFSNPNDVLDALDKETPQVLISDIRMPRGNGLDLLQSVKETHPLLPVIIMTAYSDLDSAVSSFQGGELNTSLSLLILIRPLNSFDVQLSRVSVINLVIKK